MVEPVQKAQKRARVEREEWAKRVEPWRDSGLTTAEFATELGINPRTLTYWAWTLKREASGKKRIWSTKTRKPLAAWKAPAGLPFVEIKSHTSHARFELEVRGRRLHIPDGFDAEQLRSLLAILEKA
ncbi:MAG TPA: hypothetical protein VFK05_32245 [Polyangiaceae bacterium]|nr:hypothetical protein [Polyangiaceae bacterium]